MKIKLHTEIKLTYNSIINKVMVNGDIYTNNSLVDICNLSVNSIHNNAKFRVYIIDGKATSILSNFMYTSMDEIRHNIEITPREFFDVKSYHDIVLEQLTEAIEQIKEINNNMPHIVGICETEEEI